MDFGTQGLLSCCTGVLAYLVHECQGSGCRPAINASGKRALMKVTYYSPLTARDPPIAVRTVDRWPRTWPIKILSVTC